MSTPAGDERRELFVAEMHPPVGDGRQPHLLASRLDHEPSLSKLTRNHKAKFATLAAVARPTWFGAAILVHSPFDHGGMDFPRLPRLAFCIREPSIGHLANAVRVRYSPRKKARRAPTGFGFLVPGAVCCQSVHRLQEDCDFRHSTRGDF